MNGLSLTMALLMGFTGSLHCAGMCGPIVWIIPFQAFRGLKKGIALGLYHLGRISVYALFAAVLHSFRDLFDPKIQQYISLTLGALLLVGGVLTFIPNHVARVKLPWAELVKKQLGHVMGRPGLPMIGLAGVLNGLLPCGLVYMALSTSLAAATVPQAMALMYAFGAGTLPMLLSITLLKSRLSFLHTTHVRKLVPIVMFAFGSLFMLRGMNLGIPYLSPKVTAEAHGDIRNDCHSR